MYIQIFAFMVITGCSSLVSATNVCEIERPTGNDCKYTVICKKHAGSAPQISCDGESFITFIITDSIASTLTDAFFGSTNFDARVRVIKATNNSWNDIESHAFRYYTKTNRMDLSHNKIHNIKSDAFINLFLLDSLNLSRNNIEDLKEKCFHFGNSRDPDLYELDLSFNNLHNITIDVFTDVPNLKYLFLNNNQLNYISDKVFRNGLKKLKVLYLNNNNLLHLGMMLIDMQNLEVLDISYNVLSKVAEYEINKLTLLTNLNMSHNQIEIIEPNCFSQAVAIVSIDLSYNKIKSAIEKSTFSNNDKLEYLNFFNNSITKIQDLSFVNNNEIKYFNIENNSLNATLSKLLFKGLNTTSLNLFNQNIHRIENNAFESMHYLKMLNLSKNQIDNIEPDSFKNSYNLQILDLSNNHISNLAFLISDLGNVTDMNLSNNNLTVIPSYAFAKLSLLSKLDLTNNNIITIEKFALPLNYLQFLYLNGNKFAGAITVNVFSPGKFLRFLEIDCFNITKIENESFVQLPLLARLNLSHNDISLIEPKNFINLTNLYSLDLSHNKLKQLSFPNSSLSNLKSLYLNNNLLNKFSHAFMNISGLLYLNLAYNNISDVSAISFEEHSYLKVLVLSHNKLICFNNQATNNMRHLVSLDLSFNFIKNIDVSRFLYIQYLDVSNNYLTSIYNTFHDKLVNLQSVDISRNNLTELVPGTFKDTENLKFLNVSGNRLRNIRFGCFRGLHRTEIIDISKNQIDNIDVYIFHECNALKKLVLDNNQLSSFDVEKLLVIIPKLRSISLGGNLFLACNEIVRNIKNIEATKERYVEITSVDKIYHEDNVNGIRCGNAVNKTETDVIDAPSSFSSLGVVLFCFLILFAIIGVITYFYKRLRHNFVGTSSISDVRPSVEMNASESYADLMT